MTEVDPELDLELSALLDGELDAASEARLRAAVAASPALAARLAELAAVDEALRALPAPELSEPLVEGLRRRISGTEAPGTVVPAAGRSRRGRAPRRPSPWRGRGLAALAAAAAAAFLLLALPRLRGPGGSGAPAPRVAGGGTAVAPPTGGTSSAPDEAALTELAGERDPSQLDSDLPVIGVLDVLQDLDDLPPRPGDGRG